jgi:hypothetical protein
VRTLIGVLATLTGAMRVDWPTDVPDRILHRLVRNGVLGDSNHRSEAEAGLEDLCQQLRYAYDQCGDARPAPHALAWTHQVAFPEQASASAFVEVFDPGESLGVAARAENGGDVTVLVAFADLPPDSGYTARAASLSSLADRFGGR